MDYIEVLNLEIMINNYLKDIEDYSDTAYRYLTGEIENIDESEMIMYLSSVSECIETVQECMFKIEEKYEKKISDLNEQLQQINE